LLWPVVCVFGGLRVLLGMDTLGDGGMWVVTCGVAVSLDS
jgi:hypothetical protein